MRKVASFLLEASQSPSRFSGKAAAVYYPHLAALAKRTGLKVENLQAAWEKISEEIDAQYPDATDMQKFIRGVVIIFAHAKPERT